MTSLHEGAGVSQGPHAGGFETSECDADAVLRTLGTFFFLRFADRWRFFRACTVFPSRGFCSGCV